MLNVASPVLRRLRIPDRLIRLWGSRWFALILATAAYLALNYSYRAEALYWDSLYYWEIGQRFFLEDGSFSFLNYQTSYPSRGYLFPLMLGGVSHFSSQLGIDGLALFRILAALFFAVFTTVIAPAAYDKATGRRATSLQVLFFSGMVLFFWRGYVAYPLSDFPAVACLIAGYVLFPFSGELDGRRRLRTILAGICLGSATIIRPSSVIVLMLLACFVVMKSVRERAFVGKQTMLRLTFTLAGIAVVFAPQLLLNVVHEGRYSPFVPSRGLYAKQLTWGIRLQRYETNIGDAYPDARMMFIDPVGDAICAAENVDADEPVEYREYIRLVAKYPVDFAGIYGRHLFNGLDLTYSTPYVKNPWNRSWGFSLINYALIVLAILILADRKSGWMRNASAVRLSIAFVSPAILSLPGAVEARFFLPIHLLVYAVVSWGLSPDSLRERVVPRLLQRHAPFVLLGIVFCFVLSSLTFATLEHGAVLLSAFGAYASCDLS